MDITCPQCGACFETPDHIAGKKARCSACRTVFRVPEVFTEYELERPFEEVVESRPHLPPGIPRRLPPDNSAEDESVSPPLRVILFVGEYLPGLFRAKTLITSILCAVIGLVVMGLGVFIALLGAVISAFSIGAFGLICYAQAFGMLLHGDVVLLSEALSELNSWQWILFLLFVAAPFGAVALIMHGVPGS